MTTGQLRKSIMLSMAHLKALENFEFLYTLVTLQRCLMYLREVVVKLQGESQDILCGVTLLNSVP